MVTKIDIYSILVGGCVVKTDHLDFTTAVEITGRTYFEIVYEDKHSVYVQHRLPLEAYHSRIDQIALSETFRTPEAIAERTIPEIARQFSNHTIAKAASEKINKKNIFYGAALAADADIARLTGSKVRHRTLLSSRKVINEDGASKFIYDTIGLDIHREAINVLGAADDIKWQLRKGPTEPLSSLVSSIDLSEKRIVTEKAFLPDLSDTVALARRSLKRSKDSRSVHTSEEDDELLEALGIGAEFVTKSAQLAPIQGDRPTINDTNPYAGAF